MSRFCTQLYSQRSFTGGLKTKKVSPKVSFRKGQERQQQHEPVGVPLVVHVRARNRDVAGDFKVRDAFILRLCAEGPEASDGGADDMPIG